MSLARDRNICSVIMIAWALLIVCGCAYVVFWRGESGWWWVLAIVLMGAVRCRAVDDTAEGKSEVQS
jgi:membrane protein YdbS with pleckstrin-like domain